MVCRPSRLYCSSELQLDLELHRLDEIRGREGREHGLADVQAPIDAVAGCAAMLSR